MSEWQVSRDPLGFELPESPNLAPLAFEGVEGLRAFEFWVQGLRAF